MGRRARLRRLRLALLAGVALVAAGFGGAAFARHLLRPLELSTVDARFSIRGPVHPPLDVVVVGVDDVTFGQLGLRWPFPRSVHGKVIDRLRRDGAKVIGYDVQFTEATPGRQRYCPFVDALAAPADCALVTATGRARDVVFSTTEVGAHGSTAVLGGNQVLRFLHAGVGNGLVEADSDGKQRRLRYATDGLPSFSVAVVERATGRHVSPAAFGSDGAWIDFPGPPGTVLEVPMSRVIRGQVPPSTFRNKIVVVGAVAPTLKDVFETAVGGGESMSGPELQADAVETILHGFPLRDAATWIDVLLIVLLGLAPAAGSIRFGPLRALLGSVLLAGLFLLLAQLLFDNGRVIAVTYPLAALAISLVGSVAVHYFTETRERRRTRQLFARFVPEDVVDEVLSCTDDDLRIGAIEREGTVMFSDLRGFTSFAESLPVNRVIGVLNRYLGEMSEAILDHGGTLVAYMGDGIMAVFGAPIEQADHADRGLAAAREMIGPRLASFNEWLRSEGLSEGFRMGVGLNSGLVMSGNVGSERRVEYTAIGDTTNTAARLEGMTKGTPYQLYVADSTRGFLQHGADDLVEVGEMEVRGRTAKVRVWSVPEARSPEPEPAAASGLEPAASA